MRAVVSGPCAGGDRGANLSLDAVGHVAILPGHWRHRDLGHHACRGPEYQNPVGEKDRLIDAMCHDQKGGALRLRQRLEVLPQLRGGDLVERAEGLIEQNEFRIRAKARAILTRCRMPPDNSRGNASLKRDSPTASSQLAALRRRSASATP